MINKFIMLYRIYKLKLINFKRFEEGVSATIRTNYGINITSSEYVTLCNHFKNFLGLHIYHPNHNIAMPSLYVDELWHVLLKHPTYYDNLVFEVVGRYIYHNEHSDGVDVGDIEYSTKELFNNKANLIYKDIDIYNFDYTLNKKRKSHYSTTNINDSAYTSRNKNISAFYCSSTTSLNNTSHHASNHSSCSSSSCSSSSCSSSSND